MPSYPVELTTDGGPVRFAGTLAFTDPSNAPSVAPFQIAAQANSGTSTITVANPPALLDTYRSIVINPKTTGALLRRVLSVSGSTLILDRALTATFPAGTALYLLYGGGNAIPWSMWGGRPSNLQADATVNVTAFNNLSQEIYRLSGVSNGWGIGVDNGNFYVNGELKPERSQTLAGLSPLSGVISAADSFPFTADGSVAVLHPQRDGAPVLYHQGGPSSQWTFRNFKIDCRSIANSNGVLSSPQQPGSMRDLYVSGAGGLYGMSLNDVQVQPLYNIELDQCALPLDLWDASFVEIQGLWVTGTTGQKMIRIGNQSKFVSIKGADLETMPAGGIMISLEDSANGTSLQGIYSSGFVGGTTGTFINVDTPSTNPGAASTYRIANCRFDQNNNSILFLNDVQRSISLNTFSDTNREMVDGWAQDSLYWFACGGLNKIKTNATFVT